MRKFLIALTLFIAVGAVAGAVMMWVDPSGQGWGGAPMLDLLLEVIAGVSFLRK